MRSRYLALSTCVVGCIHTVKKCFNFIHTCLFLLYDALAAASALCPTTVKVLSTSSYASL